jgi:hypothetical protein
MRGTQKSKFGADGGTTYRAEWQRVILVPEMSFRGCKFVHLQSTKRSLGTIALG